VATFNRYVPHRRRLNTLRSAFVLWFNSLVALSIKQKECLRDAIDGYSFPSDYFDFVANAPARLANTNAVEFRIRRDLTSGEPERVKNGLSNVLYWGYAQMGIRETRVHRFREKVTLSQLKQAGDLFRRSHLPSVLNIKKLRLAEFSGLSFVSKIRMFLDPDKSAALDWQIMKIHKQCPTTLLANLYVGKSTQIPITQHNSEVYEDWCRKMADISSVYFGACFRVVDVERGFFQLIQTGAVELAAQILMDA
jgi:hypothetical protein